MSDELQIITDPETTRIIEDAAKEAEISMVRIEGEREKIKEILEKLEEETGIKKKYLNKIFRIYHKNNFNEVSKENEQLEALYESVFKEG